MKSKEFNEAINNLKDMMEREAMKWFRIARRAEAHGCSEVLVSEIRNEAFELYRQDIETIANPFRVWKYAFAI